MSGPRPGAGPFGAGSGGMSGPGNIGMSGPLGGAGCSGPGPGGCGVSSGVVGSCPAGPHRSLAVLMEWSGSSYLGSTRRSPPGVPGGGITGVVPGFGLGAGARMPGSTPAGGRITPPGALEPGRLPGSSSGDEMSGPRRSTGTCPAGGGPGGSCRCAGPGCAETTAQLPRRTPPVSSRPATAPGRTLCRRLRGSDATAGHAIVLGNTAAIGRAAQGSIVVG